MVTRGLVCELPAGVLRGESILFLKNSADSCSKLYSYETTQNDTTSLALPKLCVLHNPGVFQQSLLENTGLRATAHL